MCYIRIEIEQIVVCWDDVCVNIASAVLINAAAAHGIYPLFTFIAAFPSPPIRVTQGGTQRFKFPPDIGPPK